MGRFGGGGCFIKYWQVFLFLGSCLALYLKVLGLENTFCGLRPAFPGASVTFTHMHAHRYLPPPLWPCPRP